MGARSAWLASVAVLATGCAGGGAEDDRLSRDEYIRRADAICAEYDERLDRLSRARSVGELAALAGRALPIAREGVGKLRGLRPPLDLESRVNEWLERNDENVERIRELREAARRGDETRVQEVASAAVDNERAADALARRIGLRECAKGG